MSKRVTVGRVYKYDANGYDLLDPKSEAVQDQLVRVVNKHGCPPANTMGQCYVNDLDGKFLGMVDTRSLVDVEQPKLGFKAVGTMADVRAFVTMATGGYIGGNPELKRQFAKLGQQTAHLIAKRLGLKQGEYDVRYNAGGVAVPGDITLHTDRLYISLGQSSMRGQFMWRTCEGRKDYTGGRNQWMNYSDLRLLNVAVERFKQASAPMFQVI